MPASDIIGRAVVVGAGLMGRRIAGLLAIGGTDVVLTDIDERQLQAGHEEAAGMLDGPSGDLTASTDLRDACTGAELVIEAASENLQLKRWLFTDLAEYASDAVLATNTSVLSITSIAEGNVAASRIVGAHFWNPPDLIPIVEVTPGRDTDAAIVQTVVDYLTALGKEPVTLKRDVIGFIGNRLQFALWREAMALVAAGVADAATIDRVVRKTIGLRLAYLGPLENADYIGLDLTEAIHSTVLPELETTGEPSPALKALLADGHSGAKTGRGFFEWPPGAAEGVKAGLAEHIARELAHRRDDDPAGAAGERPPER